MPKQLSLLGGGAGEMFSSVLRDVLRGSEVICEVIVAQGSVLRGVEKGAVIAVMRGHLRVRDATCLTLIKSDTSLTVIHLCMSAT